MNQADVTKLVSKLNINVLNKHRALKNPGNKILDSFLRNKITQLFHFFYRGPQGSYFKNPEDCDSPSEARKNRIES